MYKTLIAIICSTLLIASCTKDKPDPGATAAVNMADEWWVKLYLNGTQIPLGNTPSTNFKHFYTYNTSENNDSLWVDDRNTFGTSGAAAVYRFKAKTKANYEALTFANGAVANVSQAGKTVTITNGKIMKGVGHSKNNNKTDSIYMNIEYSNNPGVIYTITGHARTFFLEDDY